ncbi:expressed unknown protein [Seminavis robusta]|uniref:Reverse transcriptase Ty1/copia-type domain-containing protein n=1 Tax=Seminavis robusta TaxID=568900 RepID=A0A9N8E0N1_9STRA|nr:expressed unknown protein [Seminavis robusta]|eukprot:Sro418_g138951.1  (201) ;mRNA; r:58425-59027
MSLLAPHLSLFGGYEKSLYRLHHQSPKTWFTTHLSTDLQAVGSIPATTEVDPCLLISDKVTCLVHVDDKLFYARNPQDIQDVLEELSKRNIVLEEEESVTGFLGVDIYKETHQGEICLTQKGLTDRIIKALHCDHLPAVETPATTKCLGKDEDGDPASHDFSYASVIGMLRYLCLWAFEAGSWLCCKPMCPICFPAQEEP